MENLIRPLSFFCALLLVSCVVNRVEEITSVYTSSPVLRKGYHLGVTYVLQRPLFVTNGGGWPDYVFTEPGDGTPTVEEWGQGVRKTQVVVAVALLAPGTKLRVEKIIFLKARGGGVSHATGMLRADGVDLLINPFAVSDYLSVTPYGTLCLPDEKFLSEEKK